MSFFSTYLFSYMLYILRSQNYVTFSLVYADFLLPQQRINQDYTHCRQCAIEAKIKIFLFELLQIILL